MIDSVLFIMLVVLFVLMLAIAIIVIYMFSKDNSLAGVTKNLAIITDVAKSIVAEVNLSPEDGIKLKQRAVGIVMYQLDILGIDYISESLVSAIVERAYQEFKSMQTQIKEGS